MDDRSLSPAEKLRIALDLYDDGEAIMRQNLRRRHPGESVEEIDARLTEWLETRPGAELGDAPGRAVPFPRR